MPAAAFHRCRHSKVHAVPSRRPARCSARAPPSAYCTHNPRTATLLPSRCRGEYWGEFGYVRVAFGALFLEDQCVWASVGSYTAPELGNQVHCYEGGDNCALGNSTSHGGNPFGPHADEA